MAADARWLTTEQAALYAGFHSGKSFWEWAKRHRVASGRVGRNLRWDRAVIDEALKPTDWRAYFRKRA
jgi:hypothetical protein